MNKRVIIACLFTFCVILTSCSNQDHGGTQQIVSQGFAEDSSSAGYGASSNILEESKVIEAAEINTALALISDFEDMPEDCLLGVKWYGKEIKWTEVNAIANLVRYNITEEPYFLFVPRYTGSKITMSPISGDSPDQVLYSEECCSDDFGIIINQKFVEPNDPPQMRVTVSYDGNTAYYDFVKDGPSVINCPIIENGTFYTDHVIFPQLDLQQSHGAF